MKTLHSIIAGLRPANSTLARKLAFPLLFLGTGLMFMQPCAGAPFDFEATGSMASVRDEHTATLLPNGKVLVAGGSAGCCDILASAELYDVGLGFSSAWQPEIATASPILTFGHRHLLLTGSRFQGISQASGGNTQDSSSNYPIVQLRSLDNSQVVFLPVDPISGWSDTTFRSIPVRDFPKGPALVTVFTNGIPSDAKYLILAPRRP